MPWPGFFRNWSIAVSTGASTVYSWAVAPLRIDRQASGMLIRPAPSSYACTPLMWSAVEVSAVRSFAGVSSMSACFAADSSSAEAPAACGEAIEVPWSMP